MVSYNQGLAIECEAKTSQENWCQQVTIYAGYIWRFPEIGVPSNHLF